MLLVHTSLGPGLGMAAEQETWPAMLSPAQHPERLGDTVQALCDCRGPTGRSE